MKLESRLCDEMEGVRVPDYQVPMLLVKRPSRLLKYPMYAYLSVLLESHSLITASK